MSLRKSRRSPVPPPGIGTSPLARPGHQARVRAAPPAGPPARRPGHASRLHDEAERVAQAERERRAQARHRRLVGVRIAVLCVTLLAVFVVTFAPLRSYLAQRQELADLRAKAAAERAETENLQAELDRWQDPAYVQALARARLGFVMPGDTAYKVVDAEKAPDLVPTPTPSPSPSAFVVRSDEALAGDPWYAKLETSIVEFGQGEVPQDDGGPSPTSSPSPSDPHP